MEFDLTDFPVLRELLDDDDVTGADNPRLIQDAGASTGGDNIVTKESDDYPNRNLSNANPDGCDNSDDLKNVDDRNSCDRNGDANGHETHTTGDDSEDNNCIIDEKCAKEHNDGRRTSKEVRWKEDPAPHETEEKLLIS
ncbi:unnamed protein product [Calypogeia fissa]